MSTPGFINPLASLVEQNKKWTLFVLCLTHAHKQSWISVTVPCPFLAFLRSPDLRLAVKATRMCFRSPHPCKIKSNRLDRAFPRRSQKLLMFERRFLKGAENFSPQYLKVLMKMHFHGGMILKPDLRLYQQSGSFFPRITWQQCLFFSPQVLSFSHQLLKLGYYCCSSQMPQFVLTRCGGNISIFLLSEKLQESWILTVFCQSTEKEIILISYLCGF